VANITDATNIGAPVRPFDDRNKYAIAYSNEIKGGYHIVDSIELRNSIPIGRRDIGMQVKVKSDNTIYTLINEPNTDATTDTDWQVIPYKPLYGIISGGIVSSQDTPDMTVKISECKGYFKNGKYFDIPAVSSLTIDPVTTGMQRKDLIYIATDGTFKVAKGTETTNGIAGEVDFTFSRNLTATDILTIDPSKKINAKSLTITPGTDFELGSTIAETIDNLISFLYSYYFYNTNIDYTDSIIKISESNNLGIDIPTDFISCVTSGVITSNTVAKAVKVVDPIEPDIPSDLEFKLLVFWVSNGLDFSSCVHLKGPSIIDEYIIESSTDFIGNSSFNITNIEDLGAIGDGKTDSSASFIRALKTGGIYYIPEGEYILDYTLYTENGSNKIFVKTTFIGLKNVIIKGNYLNLYINTNIQFYNITFKYNEIKLVSNIGLQRKEQQLICNNCEFIYLNTYVNNATYSHPMKITIDAVNSTFINTNFYDIYFDINVYNLNIINSELISNISSNSFRINNKLYINGFNVDAKTPTASLWNTSYFTINSYNSIINFLNMHNGGATLLYIIGTNFLFNNCKIVHGSTSIGETLNKIIGIFANDCIFNNCVIESIYSESGFTTFNRCILYNDLTLTDITLWSGSYRLQNTGEMYYLNNGKKVAYASTIPTTGTWNVGDIVYQSTVTKGKPIGWICTTAGTPGTWNALMQAGVLTFDGITTKIETTIPDYIGQMAINIATKDAGTYIAVSSVAGIDTDTAKGGWRLLASDAKQES
jgi:hypothetical protein